MNKAAKEIFEKCPFCGERAHFHARARDEEYYTVPDWFAYYHCLACDVLFISPVPEDRLHTIYPANYYAFDDKKNRTWAVRIKEWLDQLALRKLLRKFNGDTVRVLDIGGGTGWLSTMVRTVDSRAVTYIVDLDERAKERAIASGHRFFLGRIEDFKPDEKFDLVLALNLIEHVARPDLVFQHIRQLLSAQGRLVIKTPNFRSLDAMLFKNQSWVGYHCPRHFVLFSKRSIDRFLDQAGLQIERFSYTQGAPFWSGSILLLLNRSGLIKLGPDNLLINHPLLPYLQVATAAFDYLRRPFGGLSQMTIIAKIKDASNN
jgi:SAM-dependent methyltransferase